MIGKHLSCSKPKPALVALKSRPYSWILPHSVRPGTTHSWRPGSNRDGRYPSGPIVQKSSVRSECSTLLQLSRRTSQSPISVLHLVIFSNASPIYRVASCTAWSLARHRKPQAKSSRPQLLLSTSQSGLNDGTSRLEVWLSKPPKNRMTIQTGACPCLPHCA